MAENKRRFARIPFDADITLTLTKHPQIRITGKLHDISFKGAMIAVDEPVPALVTGQQGELIIQFDQGSLKLVLTVDIAYCLPELRLYGLNLTSLDIESAGHLRRLIEVNLGDEDSLQRELSNLIEAMEAEHAED